MTGLSRQQELSLTEVARIMQIKAPTLLEILQYARQPIGIKAPPVDDEGWPYGLAAWLGTDHEGTQYGERKSRCYELAGMAITTGDAPMSAQLVHGSWHGPEAPERIGHAWLTFGREVVWEPIHGMFYARAPWERYVRAWEERTYSAHTARTLLLANGHYGRWHESRYP